MSSRNPDSAARAFFLTSIVWLLVGSTALLISSAQLVLPSFLSGPGMSFGRMRSVTSITLQYGWLTLASLGTIFFCLPRLLGAQIRSESAGLAAATLVNVAVGLSVIMVMAAGSDGAVLQEIPSYLAPPLFLGLLIAASVVVRTAARKTEDNLYVSAWCLLGASVWAPLAFAAGTLAPWKGMRESIARLYSLNAFMLLFFAMVAMGALYYVLPRAADRPLYSHGLALTGFWALAFAGPLSAESYRVLGSSQNWLQTLATSAQIMLLIPAIAMLVNAIFTLSGAWQRVPATPSIRFFVGGAVCFLVATSIGVLHSLRSVAKAVGLTEWALARSDLLILGAFTLSAAGAMTYAMPRLMGRRWLLRRGLSAEFWLITVGVAVISGGWLVSGLLQGAIGYTAAAGGEAASFGSGYSLVVAAASRFRLLVLLGAALIVAAAWTRAINVFRSSVYGEPRPIEIVVPAEAIP